MPTKQREAHTVTLKLDRSQMVSSTDMARKFASYLDQSRKQGKRFFITRNNEIEGVFLAIEDFERLVELEELAEHLEIARLVEERKDEPVIDLDDLLRKEGLTADELRRLDTD